MKRPVRGGSIWETGEGDQCWQRRPQERGALLCAVMLMGQALGLGNKEGLVALPRADSVDSGQKAARRTFKKE